jgi:hypothetical protein
VQKCAAAIWNASSQICVFGKSEFKFLKEFERNFVSLPKVDFYVILSYLHLDKKKRPMSDFFQNTKMNNFS